MTYINLYDIQKIVDGTQRNTIAEKFLGVDWVNAYGEYLSNTKYRQAPWRKVIKSSNANRGQSATFPEIAAMYLEWLCGISGWELKKRVIHLIYPTQTLYFLQCQDYQKIGISENFKSRLSSIQNATPFDIDIITTNDVYDARDHESKLLVKYYQRKVHGEWFKLSFGEIQDIKKYIESIELPSGVATVNKPIKLEQNQLALAF